MPTKASFCCIPSMMQFQVLSNLLICYESVLPGFSSSTYHLRHPWVLSLHTCNLPSWIHVPAIIFSEYCWYLWCLFDHSFPWFLYSSQHNRFFLNSSVYPSQNLSFQYFLCVYLASIFHNCITQLVL